MKKMGNVFRDTDGAVEAIRRALGAAEPRSAKLSEDTDVSRAMAEVKARFPDAEWHIVCNCAVEMALGLLFEGEEREAALGRLRGEKNHG